MNYLFALICLFRGHVWAGNDIGFIRDKIDPRRYKCMCHKCPRCKRTETIKLNK